MCISSLFLFVSFSLVYVFVCVISLLLLQVLLRCFLEPSHTCFLASNACCESDRLWTSPRTGLPGIAGLSGRLSSSKQFPSSAALHRGRCSAVLGFIIIFHSDDNFSLGVSFFQIPDSCSS